MNTGTFFFALKLQPVQEIRKKTDLVRRTCRIFSRIIPLHKHILIVRKVLQIQVKGVRYPSAECCDALTAFVDKRQRFFLML